MTLSEAVIRHLKKGVSALPSRCSATLTPAAAAAPDRKVDIRLHGKGNSSSHGARPVYKNHLDDKEDSDQLVVNK